MIFSDFLIIFDIAFFDVQIEARAKNIVKTVQKMTPRTRLELQKVPCFWLSTYLKI